MLKDGQTLLFIGDSITDCKRSRPVGYPKNGLGEGYVMLVNAILGAARPDLAIRVLNTGISGNRVINLADRWQSDVLDLKPNWLSVMIGINDVWRHYDDIHSTNQVDPERYESVYRELLQKTRPSLDGLVIMSPFFLEPNTNDSMRAMMDSYGVIAKKMAAEFDAIFVDIQAAFDAYLAHRPSQTLCADRVHPNKTGHMVIARAFLKAIQLEGV